MKYPKKRGCMGICLMLVLMMVLAAFPSAAETDWSENEWGFVDMSMDVSGGIPEDAEGRLQMIRQRGEADGGDGTVFSAPGIC